MFQCSHHGIGIHAAVFHCVLFDNVAWENEAMRVTTVGKECH